MGKFEEVLKVNVNDKTEKKGNLTYLSWAWAWAEFKKLYPDATYEVVKFGDGKPYYCDEKTGYMCYTKVTAEGQTHEMWLPVMDSRNKAMLQPTMFDINKTIMRCLTKNLAMFGLGLYIYAGEDLPEAEPQQIEPDLVQTIFSLCKECNQDIPKMLDYYKVMSITDMTQEQGQKCMQNLIKKVNKK
jgi:hypothetical protein